MKWIPTCRETTELASRSMDERLALGNLMGMRFHLAICRNCARFARQLQEMRRLFREETAADDDAVCLPHEAHQRITKELQKKLDS